MVLFTALFPYLLTLHTLFGLIPCSHSPFVDFLSNSSDFILVLLPICWPYSLRSYYCFSFPFFVMLPPSIVSFSEHLLLVYS